MISIRNLKTKDFRLIMGNARIRVSGAGVVSVVRDGEVVFATSSPDYVVEKLHSCKQQKETLNGACT